MDAALLTMVTALFVAVLASAYDQRRESLKTRDKIDESSSRIQSLEGKFTVFEGRFTVLEGRHATLSAQLAELKLSTDKNHAELSGSLADARERLARIEGYLRINPPSTEPDH